MRIPGKPDAADRAARAARTTTIGTKAKSSAPNKPSAKGGSQAVSASVSAKARSLADQKGMDVAKVERLRELIDSGDFKIDAQLIAERIIQAS